jgi:hypothetical protein
LIEDNGSIYEGTFVNGEKQGEGVYTSKGKKYKGSFMKGKF